MSINANKIVDVTPSAVRAGSASLEFNGLLLTQNPLARMCERYETADEVASTYGAESEEYAFALVYWEADSRKTKRADALLISRDLTEDTAAYIRGGACSTTLEEFKAVTDGAMTISVNGSPVQVTAVDLSSATSLSDVAAKVAEKITGTTGEYNSNLRTFIFTTETEGSTATIAYPTKADAGTDLVALLALNETDGALLWQGTDAMSPSAAMTEVCNASKNWVSFCTLFEVDTDTAIEYAKWVSTNFGYIYFPNTVSGDATTQGAVSDLATKLSEAGVQYVAPVYGEVDYCGFFTGMIASTDFNAQQGMKTYALKTSGTLPPNVTTDPAETVLKAKGYNFIGEYATRNSEFRLSAYGTLIGENYKYIDELVGQIWMANDMQVKLMDGMSTVNRVPYNETGYSMVRLWLNDTITTGKKIGVIDEGVTLSGTQKSLLLKEIGKDVTQEIFNNGYYLYVGDPGPDVRAKRGSPDTRLYYTYGGAVHKIDPSVRAMY